MTFLKLLKNILLNKHIIKLILIQRIKYNIYSNNFRLNSVVTNDTLDNFMEKIPHDDKFSKDKIEEYSDKYFHDSRLV